MTTRLVRPATEKVERFPEDTMLFKQTVESSEGTRKKPVLQM